MKRFLLWVLMGTLCWSAGSGCHVARAVTSAGYQTARQPTQPGDPRDAQLDAIQRDVAYLRHQQEYELVAGN